MTSNPDDDGVPEKPTQFNQHINTRFQKGQSGNRKGRPRKRTPGGEAGKDKLVSGGQSVLDIEIDRVIVAESCRRITVRENTGEVSLSMMQAAMRALGVSAVKGNIRAQIAYVSMVQGAQARLSAQRLQFLEAAREYNLEWGPVFEEAKRQNKPMPEQLPNPHDVVIDLQNEQVIINGPIDGAEQVHWAEASMRRQKLQQTLAELQQEAEEGDPNSDKQAITQEIETIKSRIEILDYLYPEERIRHRSGFRLDLWHKEHPLAQRIQDKSKPKRGRPQKKQF